jgi:hypothetical protein
MANEQSKSSPPEPAPLSLGKGTAVLGEYSFNTVY